MNAAAAAALRAGARHLGVELEAAVVARVERYLDVLSVWNRRLRLTSERDLESVIARHVVDSLAPVSHLPATGLVVDVGSGGGFPGIILGCVRPDLDLALIESRRRRVSFLRDAIRAIPLPRANAVEARAEAAARRPGLAGRAAVVIARALRLDVFLGLAAPLLATDGRVIAMQTPRTAGGAVLASRAHGLRLDQRHDYSLPGQGTRCLLIFHRSGAAPVP